MAWGSGHTYIVNGTCSIRARVEILFSISEPNETSILRNFELSRATGGEFFLRFNGSQLRPRHGLRSLMRMPVVDGDAHPNTAIHFFPFPALPSLSPYPPRPPLWTLPGGRPGSGAPPRNIACRNTQTQRPPTNKGFSVCPKPTPTTPKKRRNFRRRSKNACDFSQQKKTCPA